MNLDELISRDALNFRPSAIRAFAHLMNDPKIISFAGGLPSPHTFPADTIAELATRVIREQKVTSLQYGPTRGLPRLREFIVSLCAGRGLTLGFDDVMVTTGSQQALNLVAHVLLEPGDVVLVELPTYIGAASAFYGRRAELVGVKQDDEGIDPGALRQVAEKVRREGKRIKLLYTIPNFQNPSGRLMIQSRRDEVLTICRQLEIMVLEDDPYGELVYVDDADTTPIRARQDSEHVIYLGTFSKILAPGLRCGWVVAAGALLRRFELAKEAADLCSGMLDQSIVDAFCALGLLPDQIQKVREFYRDRRRALMDALSERFTGRANWTEAKGGLFTFLTLLDERDTGELIPRAIEEGVVYVPGGAFFVDGSGKNSMRLTFAKEPDERMREGVGRLAHLLFETA